MTTIKLTDVVRRFDGSGDVVVWLERLEMVAELQKLGDLSVVIPLFLEGAAYDVYAQMDASVRRDAEKLKNSLKFAFGMSPALAFAKFKARGLEVGESPDAFLADLRRLARTVAAGGDDSTVDSFVVCQFVDGLPEPTRSQLRAIKSGNEWNLAAALECAKSMLLQDKVAADVSGSLLVSQSTQSNAGEAGPGAVGKERDGSKKEPRCYGCGRIGHVKSECRMRRSGLKCFLCGKLGHVMRNCTIQGNGKGGSA